MQLSVGRCAELLREAQLIDVPPVSQIELYDGVHASLDSAAQAVSATDFYDFVERCIRKDKMDEMRSFLRAVYTTAARLETDGRLPFPTIYLGYRTGVTVTPEWFSASMLWMSLPSRDAEEQRLMRMRMTQDVFDAVCAAEEICIMGHLVTENLDVVRVLTATYGDDAASNGVGANIFLDFIAQDGEWLTPWSGEPWALTETFRRLRESMQSTLVEDYGLVRRPPTMSMKLAAKRQRHIGGAVVPRPYYELRMPKARITYRDPMATTERTEPEEPSGRKLGFRHRREGHERCRIKRGPLPLPLDLVSDLEMRGYVVYTAARTEECEDTSRRLERRGVEHKKPDEWLAIRTTEIKAQMIGDSSLPFIPSLRTLGE
jgi:hypothetical protein